MQKTPYKFRIPAFEYKNDQIGSRATKVTNRYHFWFENNFNFIHLQFNFIKLNKLEFSNVTIKKIQSTKFLLRKSAPILI